MEPRLKKSGMIKISFLALSMLVMQGCNLPATLPAPTQSIQLNPEVTPDLPKDEPKALATPAADSPAAGICAEFPGTWVTIIINPDIPSPRCSIIRPNQKLSVVNKRGEILHVRLGEFDYTILPGEGQTFDLPFSEYLAPGVHSILVDPCCGAELVFDIEL
ncbi:MAG: hypothetical protein PVI99_01555 [Anaerolineales bacterium]|jgi:hypothetical protein